MAPGDRLGPYEILAPLGAGGMGTVYKARDTRLDRLVAIKVSQAQFSERFAREARAIAQLNHPNICQLYDVGPNCLVMEYVEGKPIAAPDSPRKLLDLAVQVADGMAAAHTAGIIHRDLKPDNILVTAEARVKILDFGLAKAIQQEKAEDETQTIALTDPGTTIGTVAYMSPEQARGEQNLGPQSDQFAFGLVLYEVVAGKRAFVRASRAETMTAIIREEADPLPPAAPAPLKWVIGRLLAKDAVDRYDSSRDLYRELKNVRERLSEVTTASHAEPVVVAASSKRRVLPWAMLAAGLAAGTIAAYLLAPKAAPSGVDLTKYKFSPIAREETSERLPVWSPDGTTLAYVASVRGLTQVFTRTVGAPEAAQITYGEQAATNPRWSPDGSRIYFQSGAVWAVGANGGTPERIFQSNVRGPSIHPDGKTFAFLEKGKLWAGPRDAEPKEIPLPPAADIGASVMIGFSPDGRLLALVFEGDLWIFPYPSGPPRKIGKYDSTGWAWMPDSRRLVLVERAGSGATVSLLDIDKGTQRIIYSTTDAIAGVSVSGDGKRLALAAGKVAWDLIEVAIPSGQVRTMLAGGGVRNDPVWAPDGSHYLYATDRSGYPAIEDASATGGFSREVARMEEGTVSQPRWHPNGKQFTFLAASGGLKLMLGNIAGGRVTAVDPNTDQAAYAWSPDGEWIIYDRQAGPNVQIVKIRPGSSAPPEILQSHPFPGNVPDRRSPLAWSSTGILAVSPDAAYLMSPDYKTEKRLFPRTAGMTTAIGFTHDARQLLRVHHNTSGKGAEWQLFSIDVATGAERLLTGVDLPATTSGIQGFSLHPDGTRFATSIAKFPYDIWMLEGFE